MAFSNCTCTPPVGEAVQGKVEGTVIKGLVSGGAVTAFAVNEHGRRTEIVGNATTDEGGAFSLSLGGHSGPTLVCATGGSYTEEATGGLVQLGVTELCALVDDLELGKTTSGVLLTPFSSFHAALSACFKEGGRETTLSAASQRAALRLNDFLAAGTSGFDFRSTTVVDATAALAPSLTPEVWHGILLAGLSESARQISLASGLDPGVRVTSATLTTELLRDLDDGTCIFDGQGPSGQLSQGNVALSASTLRGAPQGLAQSIERFLEGDRNASGVQISSVADLTRALSTHASEIFGGAAGGDLDPPVVTIIEPVSGAVSGSPSIRVEATDANTIETMAFTAPAFLIDEGELTCDTPNSCTLTATLNTSLITEGSTTITVEALDEAGNRGTAEVTVTVNNSAPVITILEPSPSATVDGTITIRATATDPDGVDSFTVDIPGVVVASNCAPPVLTTNCDSDPDPLQFNIEWDTLQSNEGLTTINFVAVDTAGVPAFASVDVTVDNLAAGVINGRVDLGAPVTGATVSIVALEADGTRSTLIGVDTELGPDGSYQIEDPTSRLGPMLVVVTGGTFVDVATGLALNVNAGQELLAALDAGVPGGVVTANVNAWTTLAAKRALGHISEEADLQAAIRANRRLFELYFRRPAPELPLPILTTTSSNLTDAIPDSQSTDGALLGLTHAGLSRLAADTSVLTGQSVGAVTLVDVINVLGLDLSDPLGQFDGHEGSTSLFLDGASQVPVDSFTPRSRLAVAIFAFTTNAPVGSVVQPRNTSGISGASIATPNRLLDDITLYADPRLFPETEPPEPFDREPPSIEFAFLTPHETAALGDTLAGPVNLFGEAIDVSDITRFEIVAPDSLVGIDLIAGDIDTLQVAIGTAEFPNIEDTALTCGLVAGDPPLDFAELERQVCVCAEATDIAANTGTGVACFARAPVTATSSPAAPATLPFVMAPLAVSSSSGLDLASCSAHVVFNGGAGGAADFAGSADQQSCSISLPIAFDDQAFTLTGAPALSPLSVSATIEEVSGTTASFTFAYTVDTRAPTASLTTPAANGQTFNTPPNIQATVADEGTGVATVSATIRYNVVDVIASLTGTVGAGGAVSFPAFIDGAPDGERTIDLAVTDIAGNATTITRGYTKDTTPPPLGNINIGTDGDPLSYFPLTHTTSSFTPSTGCNTFPFSNCVFDLNTSTTSEQVVLTTSAGSAATYSRWQNLASSATNPSTVASPPAASRAPTLRLKTDPSTTVQARFDATCATDQDFASRTVASFTSSAQGLVDIPLVDNNNLPGSGGPYLRDQLGATTLCLTVRARDAAGNVSPVLTHFFKWNSTPPPVYLRWNDAAFNPANLSDDVEAFDTGNDDDVTSGSGQGASGRVFAHAYVVTPSTTFTQAYTFALNAGTAPTMEVVHRPTVNVSRYYAFNWCFTVDGPDSDSVIDADDDDFESPDHFSPINVAGTPADQPTWSHTETQSTNQSWTLYSIASNLYAPTSRMEHEPLSSGETDRTGSLDPQASYSTTAETSANAAESTFTANIGTVTLEVYRFSQTTGAPLTLLDSGSSLDFSLGGSSAASRHAMILLRGTVPSNAVTLRTAQTLNGQSGTIGFNDPCAARNSAGTLFNQAPTVLANNRWILVDQAIPGNSSEPIAPSPFLWAEDGSFHICSSSSSDCRYGRIFDDYRRTDFRIPSGRAFTPSAHLQVTGAPTVTLSNLSIPAGITRTLSPEP